jgi:DNA-binding transcriptional ArsR family regulator
MFEQTLTLLLAGEFICAVRYPDAWRFLEDEGQRRDAESFLGRLGRRLARTRQGGAWFAAYTQVGADERRLIREGFADLKHNLRLLVGFFVHVMQAQRQDQFLAPGSVIEANRLMAAIDESPNLRGELLALAGLGKGATGDGTNRSTLDRLLKRLRDDGYLVLANPEREIYEVTGKIEYLQEVVDFLMEHQSIPDEPPDGIEDELEGHQGSLL